jgi:hypothetical protein
VSAHRAKAVNLNAVARVGSVLHVGCEEGGYFTPPQFRRFGLAVFDKDVLYAGVSKDQLWRLEIASNDPDLWAEKREDEGEFEESRPRQLGGLDVKKTRTSESRS